LHDDACEMHARGRAVVAASLTNRELRSLD
jgi:hypothetical protein